LAALGADGRRSEMPGLYLEEFETRAMVIRHPIRRTVTETDNILFSTMTMNPQPLHIDFDFARNRNGESRFSTRCSRSA
jgi:acyl dehydratase